MWGFVVAIASWIAGSLAASILVGALFTAMAVCWDDWGKDLFTFIAAIVCVVGLVYVGIAAYLGTAAGYAVTAADIAVIVIAGIIGLEHLVDWFMAVVEYVIEILFALIAALVEAIDHVFPWLKPLLIGAGCLYAYSKLSGSSSNSSVPVSETNSIPSNDPLVEVEANAQEQPVRA